MHRRPSSNWLVGVYSLEGTFRWTAGQAVILLKSPPTAAPLQVEFMIHAKAPGRRITLLLDDQKIVEQNVFGTGNPYAGDNTGPAHKPTVTITVVIDRTFSVPGDRRELRI